MNESILLSIENLHFLNFVERTKLLSVRQSAVTTPYQLGRVDAGLPGTHPPFCIAIIDTCIAGQLHNKVTHSSEKFMPLSFRS